jgi:hypothetical protein
MQRSPRLLDVLGRDRDCSFDVALKEGIQDRSVLGKGGV